MELRTERLLLRDVRPADVEAVLAYQSDPAYLRHYGRPAPSSEEVRALVEMLCRWADEVPRTRYQLAITLDGRLIGTCGVRAEVPGATDAELGCELDPRHWGRGYAREASRAILDLGFATLGLRRVWARTAPENVRAIRLVEDVGLRRIADGLYEARRP